MLRKNSVRAVSTVLSHQQIVPVIVAVVTAVVLVAFYLFNKVRRFSCPSEGADAHNGNVNESRAPAGWASGALNMMKAGMASLGERLGLPVIVMM